MGFNPTDEQLAVYDALKDGSRNLAVNAYAGSGKTATIVGALHQLPRSRKVTLVYYNTAARKDAETRLADQPNVKVKTNHTNAFGAIGKDYDNMSRLIGSRKHPPKRFKSKDVASLFGVEDFTLDNRHVGADAIAALAQRTVGRYTMSDSRDIHWTHVPYTPALDEVMSELRPIVVKLAEEIWRDKCDTRRGILPIVHDEYLKMWAESKTSWFFQTDTIITDEAQDTNAVMRKVLLKHSRAQLVGVGDPFQRVYDWRGAENLLAQLPNALSLYLTRTFRFDGPVVDEANKWLYYLGAELPLIGAGDGRTSEVTDDPIDDPDVILARTNSAVIAAAMETAASGKTYSIGGGTEAIEYLATAAEMLIAGTPTDHPDLIGFESWAEVEKFANEDPSGADLQILVKLISDHGAGAIRQLAESAKPEGHAQIHHSTAHKVKGQEWPRVLVAGTWQPTDRAGEFTDPNDADAMLAYVTVTRAQDTLSRGDLAYIDELSLGFPEDDDEDSEE